MPETRTYEPDDGDELGKLVRDALGESVRPFEPGDSKKLKSPEQLDAEDEAEEDHGDEGPGSFTAAWPSWEGVGDDEPGNDESA